jgi:radical SAM protein with 4Fe4S-binding SPASM domain
MQRFAKELGVEFKFDSLMNPRIDCSGAPLEVRLTPVEVVAMDIDDPERIAAWRSLAKLGADASKPGESRHLYQCGGGVNSFAIDPYGDLSICVLSHNDRYNVRDGSMREGWDMFLRTVREKRITRVTKCTTCPLTSLCGSCAAFGELENKDPEEPVDFLCRTSHLRADIFGVDIRPHGDCEYCPDGSHRAEIDAMAYEVRTHGKDIAMAIAAVPPRDASAGCGTGACNSCSAH